MTPTYIDEQDTLNTYQRAAARWAKACDVTRDEIAKDALGVAGEAGEVADLLKKHLFHGVDLDREELKLELGDVLWYVAALARHADLTLCDVAHANIAKLAARYPNGFVPGGGVR